MISQTHGGILGLLLVWAFSGLLAHAGGNASICARHLQVGRVVLFKPMEFAEGVAKTGQDVTIDDDRIATVAAELAQSDFQIRRAPWNMPPYPDASFSFNQMFAYFLVLNSINYMYMDPRTGLTFGQGETRGAARTAQILTENWAKVSAPGYLANLTEDEAERLFRSDNPLPEIPSRVRALQAVGEFLGRHAGTDWQTWVKPFASALDLALFVARNLHGFEDPFCKRAQLFTGMLVGRFFDSKAMPDNMRDLDGMTVYADYVLPMVLKRMGILHYSAELERKVNASIPLRAGSPVENEIRAATLIASERLRKALNQTARYEAAPLDILSLDAALWLQGGEIEFPDSRMPDTVFVETVRPHHLCVTTDY